MKTFALMAIMAAYTAGLRVYEETGDEIEVDEPIEAIEEEVDEDALRTIDAALSGQNPNANEDGEEDDGVPDNYRPPPKQDQKRRERRERPDIHAHPLLRSMDLSFVGGSFGGSNHGAGGLRSALGGGLLQQQQ